VIESWFHRLLLIPKEHSGLLLHEHFLTRMHTAAEFAVGAHSVTRLTIFILLTEFDGSRPDMSGGFSLCSLPEMIAAFAG
jgi:hypothetical protein